MLMPRNYVDNMFDRWMAPFDRDFFSRMDPFLASTHKELMRTDIKENGEGYELEVDLPGYKKEDVTVSLENGYLTITASKGLEEENKDKKGHIIRQERYSGTLSRSFYVGENITHEEIRGKYENGVLTICVPKKDETKKVPEKKTIMIEG